MLDFREQTKLGARAGIELVASGLRFQHCNCFAILIELCRTREVL